MKIYDPIEEFIELVRIDSPSLGERQMADVLTVRLEELGFTVFEDNSGKNTGGNAGNLIASRPGDTDQWLMLSAHMDRVDNGLGIKPQIKDGWIVSDGATILGADDISGIVAMLDGIRRSISSGKKLPSLEVVISICEEKGLLGARTMDVSQLKSKIGYLLDNSGQIGNVVLGGPYKSMATIEVFGKAAHAGEAPEKGINAIMAAATMIEGLREGRLDEESTSNIGVIHGGQVEPNTVCEHVLMRCESRSHNYEKLISYLDYMRSHFEKNIAKTKATFKMEYYIQHEGYRISEDTEVFIMLKEALEKVGIQLVVGKTNIGTDGNIFNANGIMCIPIAVSMYNIHSTSEKANVEELILAGRMVEQIILQYGEYSNKFSHNRKG